MAQEIGLVAIFDVSEFNKGLAQYTSGLSVATSDTDKAANSISNMGIALATGLGSAIGNLVAQAIPALISGISGIASEAFNAVADYELLASSLETLVAREIVAAGRATDLASAMDLAGPRAEELLKWIQQLALQSPFTQEGVAIAFRTALSYGFASDEAQRLTTALIDFAAGSGASENAMNQIALALGQIQAKGKLSGQEVLQLVNAGIAVDTILAKAFGTSTAEIVKMREEGLIPADKAIEAIVQSLEQDFGGAAARQAGTFAGLVSSLSDIKEVGLREFFTATFEAIQPLAEQFVNLLSSEQFMNMLRQLGNSLGEFVTLAISNLPTVTQILDKLRTTIALLSAAWTKNIGGIQQSTQGAFDVLVAVFSTIQETLVNEVWPSLQEMFKSLEEAFGALGITWGDVSDILIIAAQAFGEALVIVIGIVIAAIDGLAVIIGTLAEYIPGILDGLRMAWQGYWDFVANMLIAIGKMLQGDFAGAIDAWVKGVTAGVNAVAGIFKAAVTLVVGALDAIIKGISEFVSTLIKFFEDLFDKLVGGSIIPDMMEAIIEWFQTLYDTALQLISGLVDAVIRWFTQMKDNAVRLINEMATSIVNSITTLIADAKLKFDEFKQMVEATWQAIKDAVPGWWALITGAIKTAIEGIPAAVKSAVDTLIQIGKDIVEVIKNGVIETVHIIGEAVSEALQAMGISQEAIDALVSLGGSIIDSIVNGVNNAVEFISAAINSFLDDPFAFSQAALDALFNIGASIIKAIVDGITNTAGIAEALANTVIDAFNSAIDSINQAFADIGLPVSIPLLPNFQQGVENFAGGLALVGEAGPELVSLPSGSNVLSNANLMSALRGISQPQSTVNNITTINNNYSNSYSASFTGANVANALDVGDAMREVQVAAQLRG